jgi:HEAT repeat protein
MSAPLEKLLRDARTDLVLSRIEKDPSIINDVIRQLDSEIRSIKFNSISVLGELGEKSVNSIPKLINCLDDRDWSIIREAARSLGKIGNQADNALSRLSELLFNEEETIHK